MKRLLITVMATIALGAVQAEEKSFWDNIFSFAGESAETTVDSEAAKDSGISNLLKKIADLKEKITNAKSLPEDTLKEYKEKLADLKAQLKAKVEEFKAAQQKKADELKAAQDAKAKEAGQTKEEANGLIESIGNLFK